MFRAELRKAFTPCPIWLILLGAVSFSALTAYGYVTEGNKNIESGQTTVELATNEIPRAWMTMFLFAAIAAAVFISREFDSGAIMRTVLLGRTRARVFSVKTVVVAVIGLLFGGIAMLGAVASTFMLSAVGGMTIAWSVSTTQTVLGVGACSMLAAFWGAGVGWLLRARMTSVSIVVLFILLVEPGLQRLWPKAANGFFSIALSSIYLDQKAQLLSVPFAVLVALGWIVVLLAASLLLFRRRDIA